MAFKTLKLTTQGEKRLINMYRLQYTEAEIAQAFGVTDKSLHRFLRKPENRELRERCHQEKLLANVAVRNSLFIRAVGTSYKPGKPQIIQDGVVVQEGEAAQAPMPGDLQAMKWWQSNLDPRFKEVKQIQLSNSEGGPVEIAHVKSKTEKELVDMVVEAFRDGLIDGSEVFADYTEVPTPKKAAPLLSPPDKNA